MISDEEIYVGVLSFIVPSSLLLSTLMEMSGLLSTPYYPPSELPEHFRAVRAGG